MTSERDVASVVLVGGPDSGKSNYIFRLWLAINAGRGLITPNGLPDHLEYLQAGSEKLLQGEFAGRTLHDVVSENVIPIKFRANGAPQAGKLVVPDCMGERWMSIFKKREWTQEWETHFSESCGFLIFLRPTSEQIVRPMDWLQSEKLWGKPVAEVEQAEIGAPTQVVITDLLQFIERAHIDLVGSHCRPRIGIIVSAWDLVPNDRQAAGAAAYIAEEFPLLSQFIRTNNNRFDFAAFGVSVAGGDFKSQPGFREERLSQADPLASGYVVHELGSGVVREPDLTLPVAWAMGAELRDGD